jgi:AraC-like DNA-binding protein
VAPPTSSSEISTPGAYPADHHYWLGTTGFLHVSYRMRSMDTARQQAVILLSGCGRPFRLRAQGLDTLTDAAVVGPQVMRSLDATGIELLAFHVAPDHPAFAALSILCGGNVRLLRRDHFKPWQTAMRETIWNAPDMPTVRHLFDQIVQTVQLDHAVSFALDPALAAVLDAVNKDFERPLAQIARDVGLPSARVSHLFNEQLRLPLRSYQAWRRTTVAWELFAFRNDLSLTQAAHEAGYADSAHMSRTWQRQYGVSPSYMRDQVRSFR